jgi:hypothetical protein
MTTSTLVFLCTAGAIGALCVVVVIVQVVRDQVRYYRENRPMARRVRS